MLPSMPKGLCRFDSVKNVEMKRLYWIFQRDPMQSQSTFEEGVNNVTGGDVMTEAEAIGEGERGGRRR